MNENFEYPDVARGGGGAVVSDIKEALLAASGQIVRLGGKRWRIEAREWKGHFSCVAQDLDPRDEEEARYCIMDLWWSESSRAATILAKAVGLGRKIETETVVDTGHEGIGSSRGIRRRYNHAVGTWTPVIPESMRIDWEDANKQFYP